MYKLLLSFFSILIINFSSAIIAHANEHLIDQDVLHVTGTVKTGMDNYYYDPTVSCGGDVGSGDELLDVLTKTRPTLKLGRYAGSITDILENEAFKALAGRDLQRELGNILHGGRAEGAACRMTCNLIPVNAEFVGYAVQSRNMGEDWQYCPVGEECGNGWANIAAAPQRIERQGMAAICTTVMNWKYDEAREFQHITYFRPRSGPPETDLDLQVPVSLSSANAKTDQGALHGQSISIPLFRMLSALTP